MRILHDRVLLKVAEPETKLASGIVVAKAVDPTYEAVVIAVGTGHVTKDGTVIPLNVKVDDKVMYKPGAGSNIKVDGLDYIVIKEEDIFCVIDKATA